MKISRNGQYALASVADLASGSGHESIAGIARRHGIDKRYLAQIFFVLKNAGIVSGVRGKNGGYCLSKPPSAITVGEVVRTVEGDLAPTQCSAVCGAAQSCDTYDACITRRLWQRIAREIHDALNGLTIADIVEQYKNEGLN